MSAYLSVEDLAIDFAEDPAFWPGYMEAQETIWYWRHMEQMEMPEGPEMRTFHVRARIGSVSRLPRPEGPE